MAGKGLGRVSQRLRRCYGLDRNPLRRTSDRWESWSLAVASLLVLLGVAAAAVAAVLTWQARSAVHVRETAARHPVTATVKDIRQASAWSTATFDVTWKDAAGHLHQDLTAAGVSGMSGDHVTVWVDRAGHVAGRPLSIGEVVIDTIGVAMGVEVAALVLSVGGHRLVRSRLDRARARQWDAEWLRVSRGDALT